LDAVLPIVQREAERRDERDLFPVVTALLIEVCALARGAVVELADEMGIAPVDALLHVEGELSRRPMNSEGQEDPMPPSEADTSSEDPDHNPSFMEMTPAQRREHHRLVEEHDIRHFPVVRSTTMDEGDVFAILCDGVMRQRLHEMDPEKYPLDYAEDEMLHTSDVSREVARLQLDHLHRAGLAIIDACEADG
jgi:hypothetical protein